MVTFELLTELQSTTYSASGLFTALAQRKISWQAIQSFFNQQISDINTKDDFFKDRSKLRKLRDLQHYYYDQWLIESEHVITSAIEKTFDSRYKTTIKGEGSFTHPEDESLKVGRFVVTLKPWDNTEEVMQIAINHTLNAKGHDDYQPFNVNEMVMSIKLLTKSAYLRMNRLIHQEIDLTTLSNPKDLLKLIQDNLTLHCLKQCQEKYHCNEFDSLGLTLFLGDFDEQKQAFDRCWRAILATPNDKAQTLTPIDNKQWWPILTGDVFRKLDTASILENPEKHVSPVEEPAPITAKTPEAIRPNKSPQSFFPMVQAQQTLLGTLDDEEIDEYCCPITHEVMKDPVIVSVSGISYEREAITDWINKKGTEPSTNEPITLKDLIPNRALKATIEKRQTTNNGKPLAI